MQCGFNNRSYFYRKFAELTGITVQEYRMHNV
ncbi:MAG: AraC family transcriptional regulator [Prevotella sp.]|nr:AraC family transcriptional regulator [Prevotella sp.]